jgi:hypothetical protein
MASSDRMPRDSALSQLCPDHTAIYRLRQLLLRRAPPALGLHAQRMEPPHRAPDLLLQSIDD